MVTLRYVHGCRPTSNRCRECALPVTGACQTRPLDCTQTSVRYGRENFECEGCGARKAQLEKSEKARAHERRERTTLHSFTSTGAPCSPWFAVCSVLLRAPTDGGCTDFSRAAVEAAPSPQRVDQLRQLPQVRWAGGAEVSGLPRRSCHAT